MKSAMRGVLCLAVAMTVCCSLNAQQSASAPPAGMVPRLLNYSGTAVDAQGREIRGEPVVHRRRPRSIAASRANR